MCHFLSQQDNFAGFQVASHPNIYVLDTPGVLSPIFANDDSGPRLVLTGTNFNGRTKLRFSVAIMYYYLMYKHFIPGAIKDSLLDEYEIAQFLLSILNSRKEYREWDDLNILGNKSCFSDALSTRSHHSKRQYSSDHTQVKCTCE
jgi:ribosome biogenesis GTPase A